jgi:hypothetical protein
MISFLLWCLLLIVCWPLALIALVLYPFVWLLLLPFRIVGIAVGGVLELLRRSCFFRHVCFAAPEPDLGFRPARRRYCV